MKKTHDVIDGGPALEVELKEFHLAFVGPFACPESDEDCSDEGQVELKTNPSLALTKKVPAL